MNRAANDFDAFNDPISSIPGVRRVHDMQLPLLSDLLKHYAWTDPYCGSAAYFGLTGRHGLWLAMRNDTFMPICRHPNQPDKLLLFPPTGESWRGLLHHVQRNLARLPIRIQLARFPAEMTHPIVTGSANPHWRQTSATEDALDWRYPVHVLDTTAVTHHEGQAFRDFRHNLNRAAKLTITSEALDPTRHHREVETIATAWAANRNGRSTDDVAEPYLRLLALFSRLPMRGRLHWIDGKPAAFSIWEETDAPRRIANSFADLTTGHYRGLSEFVMQDMAEQLSVQGFSRVCIGGSEVPGLDAYKRKLNPVESIAVGSAHFEPVTGLQKQPAPQVA